MGNTRYSFTEHPGTTIEEQLLYVSTSKYEKDWKSILHSHSFTELIYIVSGTGEFWTDSKKVTIRKDNILVINPHLMHTEKSFLTSQLSYIVLGVDNISFDLKSNTPLDNYVIYDFSNYRSTILQLFQALLNEIRQKNVSYEKICHNYLSILILQLTRITGYNFSRFSSQNIASECERTKSYMDACYQDPITLDSLAQIAHWDKFYLSHMFVKAYGISPINYLLERRIIHSKELLKSTDYTITQVAQSTGFSSQNYFSQAFKKSTCMSPKKYRECSLINRANPC